MPNLTELFTTTEGRQSLIDAAAERGLDLESTSLKGDALEVHTFFRALHDARKPGTDIAHVPDGQTPNGAQVIAGLTYVEATAETFKSGGGTLDEATDAVLNGNERLAQIAGFGVATLAVDDAALNDYVRAILGMAAAVTTEFGQQSLGKAMLRHAERVVTSATLSRAVREMKG